MTVAEGEPAGRGAAVTRPPGWIVARYDDTGLGAILPGAARALGVDTGLPAVALPAASRVCVVIVDGLGRRLLEEQPRSAPFLASMLRSGGTLVAGCPSTTATSMGSFGTGLPPGRHGLVGYEVMDPARGELLNELQWHPATDPFAWQPHPTVFQTLRRHGVRVTQLGNPEFRGSGLTDAALRGGQFIGVKRLRDRVELAADLLRTPGLVYLYCGDVDGAGHLHGWRSREWRAALRAVDRQLARLTRMLAPDTTLVVTADHGMIDVPHAERIDLAIRPDLADGMRILGGEARFAQVYCRPGLSPRRLGPMVGRLTEAVGDRALVVTREQAVAAGWFGPVEDRVRERIGDILVAGLAPFGLIDSRTARPQVLSLIGQHGSLTEAEQLVPLLIHVG